MIFVMVIFVVRSENNTHVRFSTKKTYLRHFVSKMA